VYQNRLFSFAHGLIAVSDSVSVEVSEKPRAEKRCGKQNKAGASFKFSKAGFSGTIEASESDRKG